MPVCLRLSLYPRHALLALLVIGLLSGCQTLPDYDPADYPASTTQVAAPDSATARTVAAQLAGHPGQSGFYLLEDGLSAFVARIAMIESATTSLDLQYYIFADDVTGRLIVGKLLEAADRGVHVRVLVDDLGTQLHNPAVATLDAHPNIEIRIFNPVSARAGLARGWQMLQGFRRTNHRMHNKLMVLDGLAIMAGGRNLADEYFSRTNVDFQDVDVFAIGPIVKAASASFDDYWAYQASIPVDLLLDPEQAALNLAELRRGLRRYVRQQDNTEFAEALEGSSLSRQLVAGKTPLAWGSATLLVDPPAKAMEHDDVARDAFLGSRLQKILSQTEQQLTICSAYFVPGKPGVSLFSGLEQRGVEVRILTNSLSTTDVAIVHSGYMKYRPALLENGVELWELRSSAGQEKRMHWFKGRSQASLHAKTFVIDRHLSLIGSVNLDARSLLQNTEIALLIDSPAINQQLSALFASWTQGDASWSVVYDGDEELQWRSAVFGPPLIVDHEPETSRWQRFKVRVLSWLPLDSQI